ncbi:hypothetical protein ACQP1V_21175 [Microtetraspora malaysiensis]
MVHRKAEEEAVAEPVALRDPDSATAQVGVDDRAQHAADRNEADDD